MATEKLKIVDSIIDFNLKGIDGKFYSIENFKSKKLIAIIFSCNHCPYVKAYEDRIIEIQRMYKNDLQVVAINSNDEINYAEDSFEQMKIRAKEKGFNFPYLRDADQTVAEKYGATHTPEIFLFDEKRTLRFHGKIDDNWQNPKAVKETYLKNAIEDLLAQREVKTPETFTIGCTIKWKTN